MLSCPSYCGNSTIQRRRSSCSYSLGAVVRNSGLRKMKNGYRGGTYGRSSRFGNFSDRAVSRRSVVDSLVPDRGNLERYRIVSSDRTVSEINHADSFPDSSILRAKNESRPSSTVIRYARLVTGRSNLFWGTYHLFGVGHAKGSWCEPRKKGSTAPCESHRSKRSSH